jgi:sensor histidine kinase YesM
MKNIRNRVQELSGKLEIESEPGAGTPIQFFTALDETPASGKQR